MIPAEIEYDGKKMTIWVYGYIDIHGDKRPDFISTCIRGSGQFLEKKLLTYWKDKFGSIENYVDLGANIGNHCVFAREVLGAKNLYAFEPYPSNYALLQKNCPGDTTYGVALGDSEKRIGMGMSSAGEITNAATNEIIPCYNMGSLVVTAGDAVQQMTLDSYNIPQIDLMKIDVENYEVEAITGALETLKRTTPVIYIEHNSVESLSKTYALLKPLGYKITNIIDEGNPNFEYSV